ncbi:hypothetical protein [Paenibacillus dendritiformis]|uniref:Uncharacterized protein n=1 Tax=Paenibacillus dendritiformis C454 TaxID=1131935 RepID=H3SA47_9BACL|nr:hypothetical protein [Paenibacillus dendritiformis]EHQ64071.1 hypothetical protein PDENDC454_01900 [Paenibacillus dendritiformis C454]CAH8771799.1 hypothetical protein H7S4_004534 [Paenibacillus dendritiformis]
MNVTIVRADMKKDEDGSYLGHVAFQLEGFQSAYEVTLFSKKGKEWDYSLSFAGSSGSEEEIVALDDKLEEDDDLFEVLLEAAWRTMPEEA